MDDSHSDLPPWNAPNTVNSTNEYLKHWLFEDFLRWASHPQGFPAPATAGRRQELIPVQVLLHLVCSEWLTTCDHIKARLNQIEYETIDPELFVAERSIDTALAKLHMWRKFLPVCREMVKETLQTIFNFQPGPHTQKPRSSPGAGATPLSEPQRHSAQQNTHTGPADHLRDLLSDDSIQAYKDDFIIVLNYLEEYQLRIDRLTTVVTATMAVEDTRRAIVDARNFGHLTWLATFFIPFGLVTGIMSMQSVHDMSIETIHVFFETTLPL